MRRHQKTGVQPGIIRKNAANQPAGLITYKEEELSSNEYLNVGFSNGVQCTNQSRSVG